MLWKDGIVGRLTSGVSGLLKKAEVKIVEGWGRFRDARPRTAFIRRACYTSGRKSWLAEGDSLGPGSVNR
jgi:pyruvate/2-oxoglutarate dehydrogenase complex dihydrolipoamide dehydrogenase (E3) component